MAFKPRKPREPLGEAGLFEYAVGMLARRMRTERELRRLMQRRAEPGEPGARAMDAVVARLKELNYLSDPRFAADYTRLRKENENLRVKVASFNEFPERRLERELEIYARAEKRMVVGVPGFAGPWESAKQDALAEIQGEEAGQSLPKRVFAKLFPSTRDDKQALPDASAPQP